MSYRNNNEPANRNNNIGFRCVGMRTPSLKRGIARAVWIPVHAGVQCPLPGPGPGAPCKRGAKHKPSAPPRGSFPKRERSLAERTPSQAKECAIVPVAGLEGGEVSALVSVQIGDRVAYRALDLLEHTA